MEWVKRNGRIKKERRSGRDSKERGRLVGAGMRFGSLDHPVDGVGNNVGGMDVKKWEDGEWEESTVGGGHVGAGMELSYHLRGGRGEFGNGKMGG